MGVQVLFANVHCDRAFPAQSTTSDVSEGTDTSLPRLPVVGETRRERGWQDAVARETSVVSRHGKIEKGDAPQQRREERPVEKKERLVEKKERPVEKEERAVEKEERPVVREERPVEREEKPKGVEHHKEEPTRTGGRGDPGEDEESELDNPGRRDQQEDRHSASHDPGGSWLNKVRHIPGPQQAPADYLSRFPDSTTVLEQDRSWGEVCDRAFPAQSTTSDVLEGSDTSLPRLPVVGETRRERGWQDAVARETSVVSRHGKIEKGDAPQQRREERPVEKEERPVEKKERPVEKKERPVEKEERAVEKEERPVVREERPVEREEKPKGVEHHKEEPTRTGGRGDPGEDEESELDNPGRRDQQEDRHSASHDPGGSWLNKIYSKK
ncbi:cilia- and flagella-associated protein 251-like [Pleurodeles waltl]|uniref:cilia- and flagella-associated protein 251-like n=1 Tax=Pleurodeles waltl TaxID=8319 RepID=UPI003709393A